MTILILGIIILLIALNIGSLNRELERFKSIGIFIGGALIIVSLLFNAFKQINAGFVGVQVLFGKTQELVLDPGLHVVNPLVEIKMFDSKTQNYTMSAVHTEGDITGDDAIRVLSADGLEVTIDATVLYRIIPGEASKILREIGEDYKNIVVRPITRTKIRDYSVYYNAVDLYSGKRDEFQMRIFKAIESDLKSRGIILEQLLVRNIMLPLSVRQAIESKINAEQDAQKMQFVLDKERQEAERKRVEAQGISDYQRIISLQLNDKMLQYEQIKAYKELSVSNNAKVIVMGKGNSQVLISDK